MDIDKETPQNLAIYEAFIIAKSKIKNPCYRRIGCSISGGSDSDILLDLTHKLDEEKKVKYVFFNTGIEYEATKRHLKKLEEKYGIEIEEIKAKKPVPLGCKQYGVPFISKRVSALIRRLQKNKFTWEDRPFIELLEKYCKEIPESEAKDQKGKLKKGVGEHNGRYFRGCVAALRWWCNEFGEGSRYNIDYNKYLKEFMISNPPYEIKISEECCTWAKKKPVSEWLKENSIELNIYGVRKSEGGIRSTAYKNCFTPDVHDSGIDEYRPLFFITDGDKEVYEIYYNIQHSDCYTVYGLKRTGCAGCPFGQEFEKELEVIRKYEPKLYKAVNTIFGKSYEYTRSYRKFAAQMKAAEKKKKSGYEQMSIFDIE